MRVLVVYESLFGNTRLVAEAVVDGLRDGTGPIQVDCAGAVEISPQALGRTDLLVIGGPTHHKGIASRSSVIEGRQLQRRLVLRGRPLVPGQAGPPAPPSGPMSDSAVPGSSGRAPDADLRAWLRALPQVDGTAAAAFDTRLGSRWSGGASAGIARRLRKHGYRLAVRPEGYVLEAPLGPLRAGELARAHAWGLSLRHQVLLPVRIP